MNILGAIIAGGQSRRMAGSNKLFLKLQDEFLIERAARKLNQQIGQLVINLNREEDAVKSLGYQIILDQHNDHQGPLAGIYSALNWAQKSDDKIDYVLTAPADAPFFPDDLSKVLSNAIGNNDIAIAQYDGYPQQLFGLWSVKCLKDLSLFLENPDNRKVISFIRSKNWVQVDINKQQTDPFMNINTPQDWQMAQDIVAKQGDY